MFKLLNLMCDNKALKATNSELARTVVDQAKEIAKKEAVIKRLRFMLECSQNAKG
jgi:hypothetical protein